MPVLHDGSPPRMRGKPLFKTVGMIRERITPADAGKTRLESHENKLDKDHPRGCGENCRMKKSVHMRGGSPPRMRGKPPITILKASKNRITPADAGKTFHLGELIQSFQDHPRGCGENNCFKHIMIFITGSPPRMRGKPCLFGREAIWGRITPADAGKTK